MMSHRLSLPVLIFFSAVCATAPADEVLLKDGKTVYGNLITQDERQVTIQASSGVLTFPRALVAEISKTSPAENLLQESTGYLKAGDLEQGLQSLGVLTSRFPARNPDAVSVLEKSLLNATSSLDSVSTSSRTILHGLLRSIPHPPVELQVLSAWLDTESEDFQPAKQTLNRLDKSRLAVSTWPVAQIADILNRGGRAAALANAAGLTAAYADCLKSLPSSAVTVSVSGLVSVDNARRARENGQYLAAGQFLSAAAASSVSDPVAGVEAESLATTLCDARATTGIVKGLSFFADHLSPLVSQDQTDKVLEALAVDQARLKRFHEARSTADALSVRNPDLGSQAQHRVEFLMRRDSLADGNLAGYYELGSWARTMGLLDEAESILTGLRRDPRFTQNVNMQLELIENQRARTAVSEIGKKYDAGKYREAETDAQRLLTTNPPREYALKATEYIQLIRFYKWNKGKANSDSGRAEATFQEAERLTNTGRLQQAIEKLNQVEADSPGSPSAQRAAKLRDRIGKIKKYDAMMEARKSQSSR